MPLPTKEKTWQYLVNQQLQWTTNRVTTKKKLMYLWKTLLTGVSASPWVVVRSSDASTVSNSDLWTSHTAITWDSSGDNHSWCVLRQTGISPLFEICIDCVGYYEGTDVAIYAAPAGYNLGTGSTTTKPTANSLEFTVGSSNWGAGGVDYSYVLQHMQSTDGKCTRTVFIGAGICGGFFFCDVPKDTMIDATTWPYGQAVASYRSFDGYGAVTTYDYYYNNANAVARPASKSASIYLGCEQFATGAYLVRYNFPNVFTGNYPLLPIPLYSTTEGVRGRYGVLVDMYWGANTLCWGCSYPLTGSSEWAQFDDLILPWNGGPIQFCV